MLLWSFNTRLLVYINFDILTLNNRTISKVETCTTTLMSMFLYSLYSTEKMSGVVLINNVAPLLWRGVAIYSLARCLSFEIVWMCLWWKWKLSYCLIVSWHRISPMIWDVCALIGYSYVQGLPWAATLMKTDKIVVIAWFIFSCLLGNRGVQLIWFQLQFLPSKGF